MGKSVSQRYGRLEECETAPYSLLPGDFNGVILYVLYNDHIDLYNLIKFRLSNYYPLLITVDGYVLINLLIIYTFNNFFNASPRPTKHGKKRNPLNQFPNNNAHSILLENIFVVNFQIPSILMRTFLRVTRSYRRPHKTGRCIIYRIYNRLPPCQRNF